MKTALCNYLFSCLGHQKLVEIILLFHICQSFTLLTYYTHGLNPYIKLCTIINRLSRIRRPASATSDAPIVWSLEHYRAYPTCLSYVWLLNCCNVAIVETRPINSDFCINCLLILWNCILVDLQEYGKPTPLFLPHGPQHV